MTSPIALVVEELSAADRPTAVARRMIQFRKCGVPLVWLVDFEGRAVMVYRRGGEPRFFEETEELTGEYVFPDVPVRVSDLLPPPGERR